MMKKSLILLLTVGLVSLSQADVLIGDFEGSGWPQGDWSNTWETNATFSTSTTIGVTSGSQSLVVSAPSGFKWQFMYNGDAFRSTGLGTVSVDVTWVASEWAGEGIWVKLDVVAVQGDGLGWTQVSPTDPMNPSYPGSWDPYYWGEVHTRTLTYTFDTASLGPSWSQLIFSTNYGGTITQAGNYYIDNIRITPTIPEPATISLVGLGALSLLRKRK